MEKQFELKSSNGQKLQRSIGFGELVFFGVIMMVPTSALAYLPITHEWSGGYSWLGYMVASFFIILSVMSYQRMISAFPNAGSAYSYTCLALSGKIGFLVGWSVLLDEGMSAVTTLKLIGIYMEPIIPGIPLWIPIVVFGMIMTICLLLGVKTSVLIEIILGLYSMVFIVFWIIMGSHELTEAGIELFTDQFLYDSQKVSWMGIMSVASLTVILLPFDGISTFAEEYKGTRKSFGNAIMVAVVVQAIMLVGSIYIAEVGMQTTVIPEEQMETAYVYLLSEWTSPTIAITILSIGQVSSVAALIAATSAGIRVLYSMGRDGVFSKKFFGYLSPKYKTPRNCTLFAMPLIIIGAIVMDVEIGSQLLSFGMCIGNIMTSVSCFVYFWIKKKDHNIVRHLICPLCAAGGLLFVLLCQGSMCIIFGCIWLLIGIVYEFVKYKTSDEFRECINENRLEI